MYSRAGVSFTWFDCNKKKENHDLLIKFKMAGSSDSYLYNNYFNGVIVITTDNQRFDGHAWEWDYIIHLAGKVYVCT